MASITGLVAATHTPFAADGRLYLDAAAPLVDRLVADGVAGLFVCGSTGEGMSLTADERRATTAAFVAAAAGRVPVLAHVGHNSLAEARSLAAHAAEVGADAVSATSPSYFKPNSVAALVDCAAEIAAGAPDLPFYYYHIPALTGVNLDMVEFLTRAGERIPNLAGLKYTAPLLHEFQACRAEQDGRFDILWGCDEMLLGALATGARGAVGSTYNIAAPLYRRLIDAFEDGNLEEARRLQALSVQLVRTLSGFPFHAATKAVLKMRGIDVGTCRSPLATLAEADTARLRRQLEEIGFFEWSGDAASAG
ncbi:dihydrodipicolinate synthase family protein [Alienimonas chondri]|uniref:N-acetylneuraminate lyase n=1 Tax=Alienimonas chondri TaxID=2681879 RepID=A0ABX1V837_9PLAN|nr:dihydrodipicolinate synthase family protein [Alienimonas chondri]NNJ24097.1 N-acetylneuraminate lyase [Alienimonas chondri]